MEETVETAVDDRRHGEVTHLAKAISVRDLLEQVSACCPQGTEIPSKQWLRLQFWPKTPSNRNSLQYTGKLNVKFMVQARQLRKTHEDSHYCAALFRYAKEFAIKFRDHCSLLFLDDKHRCKVGEPNYPVAAVERGKKVVVAASGSTFTVSDHDFTKFGLIPSVVVLCDIPESIDNTFYRGQVLVGLKDAATEPSSPMRHSTELSKIFRERDIQSPIVVLYTDGGPDHNNTFLAVQLGLISLFLHHDLDMIEAVRTAPYHSWKNPCERVNCILNLGLQAVGLMRQSMQEKFEKAISSCGSVQEVRAEFKNHPGLREAVTDSVEPVKVLLHTLFSRLKLKEKPILSFASASDDELQEFSRVLHTIEPGLDGTNPTKKDLAKFPKLSEFLTHCCYQRKYVFGVKKCGKSDCKWSAPPRLPQKVFEELHHIPDPP